MILAEEIEVYPRMVINNSSLKYLIREIEQTIDIFGENFINPNIVARVQMLNKNNQII